MPRRLPAIALALSDAARILAGAGRPQSSKPRTQESTNNIMQHTTQFIAIAAVAAMLSGCVVDNYNFAKVRTEDLGARTERLARELVQQHDKDGDDSLYDVTYIPLAHLDLHTFSAEDDSNYPGGYVEADVESYLPLASFLDMKITRYDQDHKPYEEHEYKSYFWGLFAKHKERIATTRGLRKRSSYRLLWFIPWGGSAQYVRDGAPEHMDSRGSLSNNKEGSRNQ